MELFLLKSGSKHKTIQTFMRPMGLNCTVSKCGWGETDDFLNSGLWAKLFWWLQRASLYVPSSICCKTSLYAITSLLARPVLPITNNNSTEHWLIRLSGLRADLWTKGSPVQFQSRHMPELQVRSPVGGTWEATTHWCFSPFLLPFPSL